MRVTSVDPRVARTGLVGARSPSPPPPPPGPQIHCAMATGVDGHAENAAASVARGPCGRERERTMTASSLASLPSMTTWRFVVVVPDEELSTGRGAPASCPSEVPFRDAVHNLNALGLLDRRTRRTRSLSSWRRPWTTPCTSRIAVGCSSFAGPLLATAAREWRRGVVLVGRGIVDARSRHRSDRPSDVAAAAKEFLHAAASPGEVHVLDADRIGPGHALSEERDSRYPVERSSGAGFMLLGAT